MSKVVTYLNDVNRYRNSAAYAKKKEAVLKLKQLDCIVYFCKEVDKGVILPPCKSESWLDVFIPVIIRFIYCKGEPVPMGTIKRILKEEGVLDQNKNVPMAVNMMAMMGLLQHKKDFGWKLTLELEDILKERLNKE